MTRDEIIELAKQAGMIQDGEVWFSHSYTNCDVYTVELLFFAKLIAEKEREACALVAENKRHAPHFVLTSMPSQNGTAVDIANLIRARGSV